MSSDVDEDMLTELSGADVSLHEEVTSDTGSPGTASEGDESFQEFGDQSFGSISCQRMESRQRTLSRPVVKKTCSDSTLLTVMERSRLVFPERRERLNEGFLENSDVVFPTPARRRSGTLAIPVKGETVQHLGNESLLSSSNPSKATIKTLRKTRSNSAIDTDNVSAHLVGKNPVR